MAVDDHFVAFLNVLASALDDHDTTEDEQLDAVIELSVDDDGRPSAPCCHASSGRWACGTPP